MKTITKRFLMSISGITMSIGSALADPAMLNNTSASTNDITSHLGFLSDLSTLVLGYAKWLTFIIAVLCLLGLFAQSSIAKVRKKAEAHVDARKSLADWFIDAALFVVCMMILFSFIIPQVNQFIPV